MEINVLKKNLNGSFVTLNGTSISCSFFPYIPKEGRIKSKCYFFKGLNIWSSFSFSSDQRCNYIDWPKVALWEKDGAEEISEDEVLERIDKHPSAIAVHSLKGPPDLWFCSANGSTKLQYVNPFGLEHHRPIDAPEDMETHYRYTGQEHGPSGLPYYDYIARQFDPALGRFLGVDELAIQAPAWTPYRYAFNNPLIYVDPDGKYEWRVNSYTGDYSKIGERGSNEIQYVFWDDSDDYVELKGHWLFVGPVSLGWHRDGEFEYAVHAQIDLWADIPSDYYGAYTKFDLVDRFKAMRKGDQWNIAGQEVVGFPRREMIWNHSDYGNYLENKYGSRSAIFLAFEEDMMPFDAPGGLRLRGLSRNYRPFQITPYSQSYIANHIMSGINNPMSWNQFQRATKGQFTGQGHRRQASKAYFEYLNNYK